MHIGLYRRENAQQDHRPPQRVDGTEPRLAFLGHGVHLVLYRVGDLLDRDRGPPHEEPHQQASGDPRNGLGDVEPGRHDWSPRSTASSLSGSIMRAIFFRAAFPAAMSRRPRAKIEPTTIAKIAFSAGSDLPG